MGVALKSANVTNFAQVLSVGCSGVLVESSLSDSDIFYVFKNLIVLDLCNRVGNILADKKLRFLVQMLLVFAMNGISRFMV